MVTCSLSHAVHLTMLVGSDALALTIRLDAVYLADGVPVLQTFLRRNRRSLSNHHSACIRHALEHSRAAGSPKRPTPIRAWGRPPRGLRGFPKLDPTAPIGIASGRRLRNPRRAAAIAGYPMQ